ncbi:MAG: rod-binding protein [Treponema sp.]|jgi:flagellar protein FlgJ|nr:rod-binding protein [Treponema sp.]
MEVNGLGFLNIDDYRMPPAASPDSSKNFEEILRRSKTAASENSSSGSPKAKTDKIDKDDRLYQLCLELETFLVKNLLTSMRNTVQKSGFVDDSFAGKMYEDMLYDEYAKDFTKNSGFGLAEQAYRQLSGL